MYKRQVEDDPPAAQRPADLGALEEVADAVQPLFFLKAGHTDIIRCVDAEQDAPLCGVCGHPPGLIHPEEMCIRDRLKVNMFGRETPAEVDIAQVELP